MSRALLIGGALACGFVACVDFSRVERNICGNGIVEPDEGEDCDGNDLAVDGASFACGDRGTVLQCRLLCSDESPRCPSGWSCNPEDGICREPVVGRFAAVLDLDSAGLATAGAGDLDGDGRVDLVTRGDERGDGTGIRRVRYFDDTLTVAAEVSSSDVRRAVPLVVGPLGDEVLSVVEATPTEPGVQAYRGLPERELLPVVHGQFSGLGDVQLLPRVDRSTALSVGYRGMFGTVASAALNSGQFDAPFGISIKSPFMTRISPQLDGKIPNRQIGIGMLLAGVFDEGNESVALTVAGEGFARVYHANPGEQVTWLYQRVDLPEGVVVPEGGGAHIVDVNRDGLNDVLIAGNEDTYVAYGTGLQQLSSTPLPAAPDNKAATSPIISGTFPLAVGLLDDDERLDFVLPSGFGVALTNPDVGFATEGVACPPFSSAIPSTFACGSHGIGEPHPWREATIVDINQDGRNDVVATTGTTDRIEVLLMHEGNFFFSNDITTPGPVSAMSVLRLATIPFISFAAEVDDLSVLYVGIPEAGSGDVRLEVLGVTQDVVDVDFPVFTWRDAQGSTQVSIAREIGNPVRIGCPTDGPPPVFPEQLAIGRFDDNPGSDAAMLYHDCFRAAGAEDVDQLVLLPAGPLGSTSAVLEGLLVPGACPNHGPIITGCGHRREVAHPTAVEIRADPPWSRDGLLVVLDLLPSDGRERDELVVLAPSAEDSSEMLIFDLDPDPPALPRFRRLVETSVNARIGGSYEDGWRGKAVAVDVDRDGDQDIAIVTSGTPHTLAVLRNEEGEIRRVVEPLVFSHAPEGEVMSFAVLDADADRDADDLIIATDAGVFVAVDAFDGAASAVPIELDLESQGEGVPQDVLAADFNGDGLTDLAIAFEDSVRMLRAVPVNR